VTEELLQLVSPCGYCSLSCPGYVESTCTDEMAIRKEAIRANLPVDKLLKSCSGCRPKQGQPYGNIVCETYDCCVNKKGLDFCFQCADFPCLKLAPVSERAEVRRHNTKIYNLLMLKKLGLEEYIRQSGKLATQWVKGKMQSPGGNVQV